MAVTVDGLGGCTYVVSYYEYEYSCLGSITRHEYPVPGNRSSSSSSSSSRVPVRALIGTLPDDDDGS